MNKALFIGTFLSKTKGSISIAEKLADQLRPSVLIRLCSFHKSKLLRLLDIAATCLFAKEKNIHIDVFSDSAFIIAEVASFLARLRRKRIILTLRGGKLSEFGERNMGRMRKVLARADHLQTPSLFLQNCFQKFGFEVQYLPNPIDSRKFFYRRDHVKPGSLLWVRAFNHIYNPDLAIRTLWEVRKVDSKATLTMVGPDNGLLLATRRLIGRLGLETAVEITGPVSNEELCRYYQSHDVYLNTTSFESFGMAVMEAAACGIPIVSTNVGEIPYLWKDGEDALLVPLGDERAMAGAVRRILTEPGLAQKLSTNARNTAMRFDQANILPQWESLLESISCAERAK